MQAGNIILGGDLNVYIGHAKSWGHNAYIYPLSDHISSLFEDHHLIDTPMVQIQPTRCNRRTREAMLARRLDRFLVKEPLDHFSLYRQWVGSGGLSNNSLVYVEFSSDDRKPKAPYKFNSTWIKDEGYTNMVTDY